MMSILGPIPTLVTLFCILTCPAGMNLQYRINIFVYQSWTLLFDVVFSFIAIPVLFFPMTMGYLAGAAKNFNGSLYPLTVFLVLNGAAVAVAILAMLFTRYYVVLPDAHLLKVHTKGLF